MNGLRAPLAVIFAALVPLLLAPGALAQPPAEACDAPPELSGVVEPLRHVLRALKDRKALRILVVGSASSTLGGTTGPAAGYPVKLAAELGRSWPDIEVVLQTRGGRGLGAAELAAALDAGLLEFQPDLVVWQTGTVDAVQGVDVDEFTATLLAGAEKVAAAGADLILMDQQFSRLGRATLNFAPYRQAIENAANAGDAILLRRYELMRHWADTGQIDLERAPRRDWQRTADLLHACLGKWLAKLVLQGVREARR